LVREMFACCVILIALLARQVLIFAQLVELQNISHYFKTIVLTLALSEKQF